MQTSIYGISEDKALHEASDSSLILLLAQFGRNGETVASVAISFQINNILKHRKKNHFTINDSGEKQFIV